MKNAPMAEHSEETFAREQFPEGDRRRRLVPLEPAAGLDVDDGRRLYIAKFSLRCLALQDEGLARQICDVLAVVRVAKAVHHHVVDLGRDLDLVSETTATSLYGPYDRVWKHALTDLFRGLGHRPSVPRDRSMFLPLLEPGDRIVASCSDQGYFTFATGDDSARRMFADNVPLPELQLALNARSGPTDLVMIKGQSLSPIQPELGVGQVGARYGTRLGYRALSSSELELLDQEARCRSLVALQERVTDLWMNLSADERQVLRSLLVALGRSLDTTGSLQ